MFQKKYTRFSDTLGQNMDICVFGHFGFALLLFPTITDSCNENEKNGLIDSLHKYIQKGKLRVFTISSVNFQSWLNENTSNEEKSQRHFDYNSYIIEELVPFIFSLTGGPLPIITCGAAIGAFHAANTYFRRPDLFYGTIALSGTFNIEHYSKDYFDSNCYFNSPLHYLPNLTDPYWLSFLRSKHHVYLMSGSGRDEYPENSIHLSRILEQKEIPHYLKIWSDEYDHSFKTWNKMLSHIFSTRL